MRSKLVIRSEVEQFRSAVSETWDQIGVAHPDKAMQTVFPDSPFGRYSAAVVDEAVGPLPYVESVERYRPTPQIPFSGWAVSFKPAADEG